MHCLEATLDFHDAVQGIQRSADSMAASTEKAAADFDARQTVLSISPDQAMQVADLLKAVRETVSEIAAGPQPAPEPQKSEKTGKAPILLHNRMSAVISATGQVDPTAKGRGLPWSASSAPGVHMQGEEKRTAMQQLRVRELLLPQTRGRPVQKRRPGHPSLHPP